ncbi:MAG: epoxide hydrolase [Acidimicrobiia bacterium]|nr:epoxide hydrolase [Acidimicrobiia bacterium]
MTTEGIDQFHVRVGDDVLEDLAGRLAATRFPDQIEGTGWEYGIPTGYVRELVEYWRDGYDWRAQEERLNQFDQFRTTIDGQSIHFIHARSSRPDAFPLLLIHGWPGSVVEFLDAIPRLADEFHVVAPSLPGYGFSEPTRTTGWSPTRIARAFIELMPRLGYDRYGAQGGDWGAQVTTMIGALDPEHCAGIHLNMPLAAPPKEQLEITDEEQADLAELAEFRKEGAAYSLLQGTKPQTLGVGLNDSPAGLAAWIVEKFQAWSDCDGDPENAFTKDQLLTNVMLYWVNQTITSSARLYWERQHSGERGQPYVSVPTGVARYPREILKFPRSWVEQHYNVTRWETMPRGGHFAAMEQPELFADDVGAFFGTVR